ncbi:conjugal transfer protein [Actinomadura chibensis]|uniref:Conjugal transfer protein n=1 Tax=Actinomadura chibensis TaxID=392828 RepID=A0A5D0NX40_9ACTN|nr:conjugal transfer protein [Actinomadura chibensis]TYB48561.1 conjugal transfer protein [Actinomadura chibensis]
MRLRRSADAAEAQSGTRAGILPPPRAALATAAMKIALWGLVGCGPAALLLAAAKPAAPESGPAVAEARRSAAGPSGFAELYVAAYLRAGTGDTSLKLFFPDAPPVSNPPEQRTVGRTVTTGAREVAPGYWSVTVAADVAAKDRAGTLVATGVHYFRVAVFALGDAAAGGAGRGGTPTGYVAAALPAEVAAPATGTAPDLGYDTRRRISGGPLADTVRQALAAYLGGAGDLSRYLTPGTDLRPIVPAPYRRVELGGVALSGDLPDADGAVPADGTRARVLAEVEAVDDADRRWPLTYALTVTARAGRWEIAALDDVPRLGGSGAPAVRPPPSAPATGSARPPGAPSGGPATRTPEPEPTGGSSRPSPSPPAATPSG